MNGRSILLCIVLLTSISITTIVYSAFNTSLQIKGDAIVRSIQDIRITNITVTNSTNDAYETYNNKYSKDTTSLYATLPANSSITYTVEITNKSSDKYDISSIQQLSNPNSNINIDISLVVADIVNDNSTKNFTITLTNNTSTEQIEILVYKYEFLKHINSYIVYEYSIPDSYELTIPYTGKYKIELWGAEGGASSLATTGKGAYVKGNVILNENTVLYAFVGEHPTYISGSCYQTNPNAAFNGSTIGSCAGGGGATDIRLIKSENWYDETSLRSRIIVAGAGGGAFYSGNGGHGGELNGLAGVGSGGTYSPGGGATQLLAKFGQGIISGGITCQGGNGYYAGYYAHAANAGGGSSYISGYQGCIAITSQTSSSPKCSENQAATDISCSYHYSGYKFTEMQMIGGDKEMNSPNGTTEIGHSGNGYFRITFLERVFE